MVIEASTTNSVSPRYKWVALTNTTLGIFMATINSSIILISLPAIFRGVGINPLSPGNVGYLLWLLQGYMLVTAVLVISLGRIGDIFGRVRIYNLGFLVFSIASILLALDPYHASKGALWLVIWRLVQGVGGAMLFANSSAIIADAFPVEQRGLAIGINQVAAIGGSFIGLIAGGLLSIGDWRLVFWVSVPFGFFGTVWGYISLKDNGKRAHATIDWWGNLTFALGLTSLLVGMVYGIQPYHSSSMGWFAPKVIICFALSVIFLIAFFTIEVKVKHPMFNLHLFKIRAFAMGSAAGFLAATARGGLQFMLIIWLQGIWLPIHGYAYDATPLWAGIYLLPLTLGFLIAGPVSGWISDRHGARTLSTIGMLLFGGLEVNRLPLAFIRSHIGYVGQEPVLFSDTIAANIALGRPDARREEIVEAAVNAAIHEDILAQKDGYDTLIGERGVKLSGGQRQRLALARALLCDHPVLIIDDGLSAVDVATEHEVFAGLKRHFQGKTVVIVSNRIKLLSMTDHIIILGEGAVQSEGDHDHLLATNSLYRTMFEKQMQQDSQGEVALP